MKMNRFTQLFLALLLFSTELIAQNEVNESVSINGPKFTYPLIEKWIAEYAKVNPKVRIKLEQKLTESQVPDLKIVSDFPVKDEQKGNLNVVYVGRYALLPVTNSKNLLLAGLDKKGLSKKEVDNLFFEVVDYENESKKEKLKYAATIYSRESQSSTSTVLAEYFGHTSSEIRGKKVFGDDIYLLSAIKKDSIGITYNNLGYLFDISSRKLKDGLALLPLDLKKETKDVLSGNLDDAIIVLERSPIETIPVEKFGFVYSQQNARKEVSDFLKWVLTDGQKFNHGFGFLNLDKNILSDQSNKLTNKLLSYK
jgi:phosphate transport system substrate-binding protein